MRQETQWTTIFWEGWTALALCAAAVFWPGSAALGLSGCALAGAGPCGGSPRPLDRVVALGGEGPAADGGGADGTARESTYCYGRGFFFKWKWACALVARG